MEGYTGSLRRTANKCGEPFATHLWIEYMARNVGGRRPDEFLSCSFLRHGVGTGDRNKLVCTLLLPQRGHRRQEETSLYPSSASVWIVYGDEKLVFLLIPTLWKVWGYKRLVLLLIPTLWKVWGYGKLVLLLIPTLWKVWGYEKHILLQIPKSWKPEGITRELYSKMSTMSVVCFGSI